MPSIATSSREPSSPDAPLATAPNHDVTTPGSGPQARRNFLVLVVHSIVLRAGWIFKTESIIIPAVLDTIAGAGWVRGWLPLLNRFGHSVPPLLLARRVNLLTRKKWALFAATTMMSLLFLLLALLFTDAAPANAWWAPLAFLVIYAAFFMGVGVYHLAFNTLQGKLIATTHRGRLMLAANTIGSVVAILCALWLLPGWLSRGRPRFDLIFGLSGLLFGVSAITVLFLAEAADHYRQAARSVACYFLDAYRTLATDAAFRRLGLVGALFGVSIMLFPHYQNLGLVVLGLDLKCLMWWVVIQNLGTGLFSIPAGAVADRWGNRLVLQVALLGMVAAPALAVAVAMAGTPARNAYHLVFVLVGLTPVVYRTIQNFALELCRREDHPRYLSTLGLCMAGPMFLSPIVGFIMDWLGYPVVFIGIAGLVAIGWLTTFWLQEPREHVSDSFSPADD
ncbi:MAG: MFS transporter [Pirellulaceae bacterium]